MTFPSIVFSGIKFGNQLTTEPHTGDVCQEIHYLPSGPADTPKRGLHLLSASASCESAGREAPAVMCCVPVFAFCLPSSTQIFTIRKIL